ncbi:putative mitochondrial protein [Andalucia godoyi]|uniref:Putative mitochondrial protein n=1 Tax=Andalucia godoyi TaxID=505711 RepID=A0A8K0F2G5_ANDGO|nr:putative mitochondrial protein [Andalucia godoyi]|eukprot:ANDGO_05955.mRNA.1 putative mitochondrial protein
MSMSMGMGNRRPRSSSFSRAAKDDEFLRLAKPENATAVPSTGFTSSAVATANAGAAADADATAGLDHPLSEYIRLYGQFFPTLTLDRPKEIVGRVQERAEREISRLNRGATVLSGSRAEPRKRSNSAPFGPTSLAASKVTVGASAAVCMPRRVCLPLVFSPRLHMRREPLLVLHWENLLVDAGRLSFKPDVAISFPRPGVVDGMNRLAEHFQIALVSPFSVSVHYAEKVVAFLRTNGVLFDAMYTETVAYSVAEQPTFGQEEQPRTPSLHDSSISHSYDAVYEQFHIEPSAIRSRVLIIGSIDLDVSECSVRDGADLLFNFQAKTSRSRTFSDALPRPFHHQTPCVLLVPNPLAQLDGICISWVQVANLIFDLWIHSTPVVLTSPNALVPPPPPSPSGWFEIYQTTPSIYIHGSDKLTARKTSFSVPAEILADAHQYDCWVRHMISKLETHCTETMRKSSSNIVLNYWILAP